MHQQLFIGVALELRLRTESFIPWLLYDLRAGSRIGFVQRVDCGEVDLFVYVVLKGGGEIVSVVVCGAFGMIVTVVVVLVVTMGHDVLVLGVVAECGVGMVHRLTLMRSIDSRFEAWEMWGNARGVRLCT